MGLARVRFVRDEEHSSPPPSTPQMRGKMLRLLVCESPSRLDVGLAVEYPPRSRRVVPALRTGFVRALPRFVACLVRLPLLWLLLLLLYGVVSSLPSSQKR